MITNDVAASSAGMSDQVWEHTLEQRVAASTYRRYYFGLRLAIAQANARSPCPYPSDRTPPDANMKLVVDPLAWTCPSDLDRK